MIKMMQQKAIAANLNFDSDEHKFVKPVKKIIDEASHGQFQHSMQCMDFTMFLVETQKAVKTKKMSQTELPAKLQPLYDWLEKIQAWLDDVPPVEQPMRFGNKAFRQWVDKIAAAIDADLMVIVEATKPDFVHKAEAIYELREYLLESFGSYERIDCGTGHELNFIIFLYCMCKVGFYGVEDYEPLINKIFQRYLVLMRRIQTYYYLEPAGSHGVWGLDDYQHLAFLYGAAQL